MKNAITQMNPKSKLGILCAVGIIAGTALLLPGAGNAANKAVMRARLALVAGENPSLPNCNQALKACADGDARLFAGPMVKVDLDNLDPARFPAGPACNADVTVGAISANGLHLDADVAPDGRPVTKLDFKSPGSVIAGDAVKVTVTCKFTNAIGNVEMHMTQWAGTF